ncbi:MAG: DNA-methyltransferase [Nitriliruptorales bacterium]
MEPRDLPGAAHKTDLGALVVADCLDVLRQVPDDTFALVVTSPPYNDQPKYRDDEDYARGWYTDTFLKITDELLRTLQPSGSFLLNYKSKRVNGERGTLQYELVFWLREQGWLFAEDYIWVKPSPPPGRWRRYLKDAVEYCFQFTKTTDWSFYPDQVLQEARWDRKDVARRKKLAHNFERANAPSGHGRKRVQAGPDMVRPSNALVMEPEFGPNPTRHPARFPVGLPQFFIELMTQPGDLVCDPFAGTGTTAVAAELTGRRWLCCELDPHWASILPGRLEAGS